MIFDDCSVDAGFVLANKPSGMSSNLIVGRLKRSLSKKVGHTGTLDRFASGLMLLMVGRATSLSEYFLHTHKSYEATFSFGKFTDTHDPHGDVIDERSLDQSVSFLQENRDKIQEYILQWTRNKEQIPPTFSALKTGGKRYSDLARSGRVELPKVRPIEIYNVTIKNWDSEKAKIVVSMDVSGGTYIRSFARDLATDFSFPVHLSSLCRTGLGDFNIESEHVWTPHYYEGERSDNIQPKDPLPPKLGQIRDLLPNWPEYRVVDPLNIEALLHGKKIQVDGCRDLATGSDFFISGMDGEVMAWAQKTQEEYHFKRIFVDKLSTPKKKTSP